VSPTLNLFKFICYFSVLSNLMVYAIMQYYMVIFIIARISCLHNIGVSGLHPAVTAAPLQYLY